MVSPGVDFETGGEVKRISGLSNRERKEKVAGVAGAIRLNREVYVHEHVVWLHVPVRIAFGMHRREPKSYAQADTKQLAFRERPSHVTADAALRLDGLPGRVKHGAFLV